MTLTELFIPVDTKFPHSLIKHKATKAYRTAPHILIIGSFSDFFIPEERRSGRFWLNKRMCSRGFSVKPERKP